ncbi:beta-L-arabinofuranosidase domain-containing protein [Streptomyces sp. NBC_00063]|uniref:beta-L-arabinofuranosidase domain-containing protein n=1 Tax=Streptomyces sp. NBC_00063 TaxID=2975638 RepID=UPI00224CAFAF|nr:beta-L-arabinofuranosidase domain-containing protein [Streptomyces sp. NBC_00063]MCX5441286.1 glycoside hydrolase family 127 protein [Streptomyces sp. NBC_00063]
MNASHHPARPNRRHVIAAAGASAIALSLGAPAGATARPADRGRPVPAGTVPPRLTPLPLSSVTLLNSPFRENMRRTCAYLLFVDPDRLLHTFRLNAGLPSSAEPCGGWEDPAVQLRGHSTGHLLSGLAQAHANTGDDAYAAKGRIIVDALAACQAASPAARYTPGYLSAFPEQVFDQLETGGRPWAPYYTIHKIMAGLLDQYLLSGNYQALDVVRSMAAWVETRTSRLTVSQMQTLVLRVEFGGMNEVLSNLYLVTGDPAHLRTARRFDHEDLYGPLAAGRDELDGRHANTEIAKIVGAAREYEATGEQRYRDIAAYFWDTVVHHHSYAIGGNSNQEFFGPPGEIVSRLSEVTCENCNSYNMLKLGRQLFLHDPGNAVYMDHYEWTLYNQMLGEQDPDAEHGFVTYYTGLWAGSQRQVKGGLGTAPGSYSSDYDNFSCDHGTGMETHTKFADSIYFRSADALWVNLFIPSQVTWAERGVTLRQETRYPDADTTRLTVTSGGGRFTLKVRIPGWLADHRSHARVRVNGRPAGAHCKPGTYLALTRNWRSGDVVEVALPMEPVWRPAPDNPQVRSLSHGPVVLAGTYGSTVSPTIPHIDPASVRRLPRSSTAFTATADGAQVSLLPFHRIQHQHYNVYWAVSPKAGRERELAHYAFDEGHGSTTADSQRSFPDGELAAGAGWTAGRTGAAVALDSVAGGHVVLPPGLLTGLEELTVSAWVRVDSLSNSARVFDLGYHKDTYLFLAVRTGTGKARAALKIAGMEAEDFIDASDALPQGRWTHVALTVGDGTGVLYVDGVESGRNDAMVSSPLLLGTTTHNYLGRSQNSKHPYLQGAIDSFRVHNRALSATDVAALFRADA